MTKHYCDVCRKELVTGEDERYSIRIETYRHGEAIELTEDDFDDQDDPDHLDAMDDLLSQQHPDDKDDYGDDQSMLYAAPTVGTQAYDLCGRCFLKYQVNPLGLERPQSGRYSPN
jgi:hypothetical protein